ncbi:MAG: MarR family winged helix-turn-helix transcriptional regulator [Atopobiaceae bacterium]
MPIRMQSIDRIRFFNRHYVPMMGLLNQRYLGSSWSTMEADVLIEIGRHPGCTARDIAEELKLDKGYLSRILRRFEEDGLLRRTPDEQDGRCKRLGLTTRGTDEAAVLIDEGRALVGSILSGATDEECAEIADSMERIERIIQRSRQREEPWQQ